jgi:nucleotide-binding universal stress UspA family protein
MSERILIPLDGSELGETALRYVEGLVSRLAPGEKVEVTLLHVVTALKHDVRIGGGGGGSITVPYSQSELDKMKADAAKYLDKVGENLKKKKADVSIKVATGQNPADEIIKAEAEVNADLVAMSTHGRAGISRWAFGSVTDRVLRGGKVPVLMVRAKK